jgi:hypothetical protein
MCSCYTHGMRWSLPQVMLGAAICAILAACASSGTTSSSDTTVFDETMAAQVGRITTHAAGAPCYDTVASLKESEHDLDVHDDVGYDQLLAAGHAVTFTAGQRVRAINETTDVVRFRLLDGRDAGIACYVLATWTNVVKDVHDE